MEKWREDLYESNYLAHAGKPGMKWGYTDGHRNGNKTAELVKLNTGMGIRPARSNGARQIIATRPESGDEHDAPNNANVRTFRGYPNSAKAGYKMNQLKKRIDDQRHANPKSNNLIDIKSKPIGKTYNEKDNSNKDEKTRSYNNVSGKRKAQILHQLDEEATTKIINDYKYGTKEKRAEIEYLASILNHAYNIKELEDLGAFFRKYGPAVSINGTKYEPSINQSKLEAAIRQIKAEIDKKDKEGSK